MEIAKISWLKSFCNSLLGIVSYGVGCGAPGYPGAYTRASCYLKWIGEQFNLDSNSSPHIIGHDWNTACPAENEIPPEWLEESSNEIEDDDPDTSDAVLLEGRREKFTYSNSHSLTNQTSNYTLYDHNGSSMGFPTHIKPTPNLHFKGGRPNKSSSYFQYLMTDIPYMPSHYVWVPLSVHPLILYPQKRRI